MWLKNYEHKDKINKKNHPYQTFTVLRKTHQAVGIFLGKMLCTLSGLSVDRRPTQSSKNVMQKQPPFD